MSTRTVRKNIDFDKETIQQKVKQRKGSFIGMLDDNYKSMKKSYNEHNS